MMTDEYRQAYEKLNPSQRQAVEEIEGPVLVAAGPGTGKTQILALRIANILLKTDVQASNILAITFTESGASAMRRRLAEIIGTPAYAVAISTFHGFCNEVIKNEPESFPNIIGANNITEIDQIRILEEIILANDLVELRARNDSFYYLRAILSALNELKREGVGVDKFQTEIEAELKAFEAQDDLYHSKGKYAGQMKTKYVEELKRLKKNKELGLIYEAYQSKLRELKYYDYSDMVGEVAQVLKSDRELLLKLQEQYQYLLIDEHQDTNNAQNQVIELLANYFDNPNLFVVGDDKQAIFRFQGASLENFLYFRQKYPQVKLIVLEDNYRSHQKILDVADSLLAGEKKLKARSLSPKTTSVEPVKFYEFSTLAVEEYFLAEDIAAKIKAGVNPAEIAVFYRDNRDVLALARSLERAGVPVAIESDQDILDDADLRKLIVVFRALSAVGDERLFVETLHLDWLNFDPLAVYKLIHTGAEKKISLIDLAKDHPLFSSWVQKYLTLAQVVKNESLTEAFEQVVRDSGFLNYLLTKPELVDKLDKLTSLFDEAKDLVEKHRESKLIDFITYLDLLETHQILLKKKMTASSIKRVRLMTAHKSKGLEFEHVYIVYFYDGHWGNKKRRELIKLPTQLFSLLTTTAEPEKEIANDDERRLFYVALTRAKQTVTITYSRRDVNQRELLPSQFLGELRQDLIKKMDATEYEQALATHQEILFAPRLTQPVSLQDKDFIRAIFLERGLAVTHLNNYLQCPWNYFYTNLLRLPKAQAPHLMYGTAIHAALQDFFKQLSQATAPDKDRLLTKFADQLHRQALSNRDYRDLLARGQRALGGYFDFWSGQWRTRVLTEFNVPGVILTPEIRLTGKLDKIEILNDKLEVNVVDYKTGRPKTRGYVEGSTKNSGGDIKRQIVFYKLLLDNYPGPKVEASAPKYKMVSAEIDFVEPDARGQYKKELFSVSPEEEKELIELIKKTADEILNLKFWNQECADPACEFCAWRRLAN